MVTTLSTSAYHILIAIVLAVLLAVFLAGWVMPTILLIGIITRLAKSALGYAIWK